MFCQMQWCQLCSEDFKFFCQEESFVFTLGAGAAPVIVTKADLAKSLEQLQQLPVKLHLRKVSEVAMSLVAALEVGSVFCQWKFMEIYRNPIFRWLDHFLFQLSFPMNVFTAALLIYWANVMQSGCNRECSWERLFAASQCSALSKQNRIQKQNLQREIGYDRLPKWLVKTSFLRHEFPKAKNEHLCGPHWLWQLWFCAPNVPRVVHSIVRTS